MKIKLLHAVLHDGQRAEAGEVGDIEEAMAMTLIASGAAVAMEEPQAGNEAPKPNPATGDETKTADTDPTKKADKAKAEGK